MEARKRGKGKTNRRRREAVPAEPSTDGVDDVIWIKPARRRRLPGGARRQVREPEPYGGDIRGSPRCVILGLNPGAATLDFQARHGVFAEAIRQAGSYSAWASSHPYLGDDWTRVHGRNRYGAARLRFARAWLKEPDMPAHELLTLELYPWHPTRVTAPIVPCPPIVETFIWQPLADLSVQLVFAFGKPWLDVCKRLGLREISHWGRGGDDFGSIVPSRAIVVFELPSHQRVVIVWQSGYAGPPGPDDTERLRWLLR